MVRGAVAGTPERTRPAGEGAAALVLVGLMGSGKTTVARLLGPRLGWPVDGSDESIEAAHGRTVRELRDALGVDGMHALEAAHLLRALERPRPRIVTPAAFTIEVDACRTALAGPGVRTVWLRADPAILARRFHDQPHRPAYGDDPATFLAIQAARRDPWFGAVAGLVLDAGALSPHALADRIVAWLGRAATHV